MTATNRATLAAIWLVAVSGCAGSPTAPTAIAPVTPPPVAAVPAPAPPSNPLLSDPRFDRAFYRQFALNGYESPNALSPLRRQTQAPSIYLRTVDDAGRAIDARSLEDTAAALINVAGALTGVFGLAGMERGMGSRVGQPGWITVFWHSGSSVTTPTACAEAITGGDQLTIYYRQAAHCRCAGGGAIKPLIVKHELGHVLGFRHTDSLSDLMHNGGHQACDMEPSARETFHARVAYSQPIGSLEPR
jgi:hypothetical protein